MLNNKINTEISIKAKHTKDSLHKAPDKYLMTRNDNTKQNVVKKNKLTNEELQHKYRLAKVDSKPVVGIKLHVSLISNSRL